MTRLKTRFFALSMSVLIALPALALDSQPVVEHGQGYKTWMAPKDAKLWRLETLLYRLRHKDKSWRNATSEQMGIEKATDRQKTVESLGIPKVRVGRSMHHPVIDEPVEVVTRRLGFEWRKHAILSFPAQGRREWFVVVLFQDSNDQDYWRPYQIFMFDTDPVAGLNFDWPDILDDAIPFMGVRHLDQNTAYGRAQVMSLFKYDEKRLRLTWQEVDTHWHAGKFAGNPTRMTQDLKFGNQRIERSLVQRQYLFMEREEWEAYKDTDPYRVVKGKERFSWNPLGFSFYHPEDELLKLKGNKVPEIRRQAARRLGLILKNRHKILEKAMQSDKDAMVRIQSALALEAIGDTRALPAIEKALKDWDEPDNVVEALEKARDTLMAIKEGKGTRASRD